MRDSASPTVRTLVPCNDSRRPCSRLRSEAGTKRIWHFRASRGLETSGSKSTVAHRFSPHLILDRRSERIGACQANGSDYRTAQFDDALSAIQFTIDSGKRQYAVVMVVNRVQLHLEKQVSTPTGCSGGRGPPWSRLSRGPPHRRMCAWN
jgi:hypothetical protein